MYEIRAALLHRCNRTMSPWNALSIDVGAPPNIVKNAYAALRIYLIHRGLQNTDEWGKMCWAYRKIYEGRINRMRGPTANLAWLSTKLNLKRKELKKQYGVGAKIVMSARMKWKLGKGLGKDLQGRVGFVPIPQDVGPEFRQDTSGRPSNIKFEDFVKANAENKAEEPKKGEDFRCYKCLECGHYARHCPNKRLPRSVQRMIRDNLKKPSPEKSDSDALNAHPHAVKAGGLSIVQNKTHLSQKKTDTTVPKLEETSALKVSTSPPKQAIVQVSGAPQKGNADFPVEAAQSFHDKPQPTHDKGAPSKPIVIHQPRK